MAAFASSVARNQDLWMKVQVAVGHLKIETCGTYGHEYIWTWIHVVYDHTALCLMNMLTVDVVAWV